MSPERLTRFFTKEDQGYRVSRELRAAIVFSVHDLMADAPFSRLDLISCRNLLIYLRPEVQQKVLSLFHFALREGGILFLGTSETVGGASDHFEPISKKQRIYRHIGRSRPGEVELPARPRRGRAVAMAQARAAGRRRRIAALSDLAQRLLLESYAPASVLVNRKHQGLYYFGPTDRYLKMPTGVASLDLLASAREGLRPAIRAAFEKASQGQEQPIAIAGRVKRNGHSVAVTVSAQAVKSDGEELVLLSFLDVPKQRHNSPKRQSSRRPTPRGSLSSSKSSMPRARNSRTPSATVRPPKKRSGRSTKKRCRSTRSSRPPTRNSKPQRRNCNRSTRSSRRSIASFRRPSVSIRPSPTTSRTS